jgi:hypothetical protein
MVSSGDGAVDFQASEKAFDLILFLLGVQSRYLMVYYAAINGRMRYGTESARERPHDSGGPLSNTT